MNCPKTEILERLALGFLEDEAPVREHAAACAACAGRLEALAREHAVLAQAAKAVRLPRIGRPRRAIPWLWLGGVAAAVLIGVVAWLAAGNEKPAPVAKASPAARPAPPDSAQTPLVAVGGRAHYAWEEVAKRESAPRKPRPAPARSMEKPPAPAPVPEPTPAEPRPVARPEPPPAPPTPSTVPAPVLPPPVAKPDPPPPPPPEPERSAPNMFFKHAGINPTIDTDKDALSTFALDVDTASYTIVRNYLRRGQLPPLEAVRVEEFLNYFRYAEASPPSGDFAIHLEAAPSPFDAERHLVRIAIVAREMKAKDRKDANLTFVIDISGSMAQENRLGLVKQSLRFLIDRLRPADRIGVVVYGSYAKKILDPTPVAQKHAILGVIDALNTEGSTNAGAGLEEGYKLAAQHFDVERINRVILCSDGVANTGVTDPEAILKRIKDHAGKGITLSTLGFGMGNYNDVLMEKLANSGNGNYAYVDDFEEAKKIFGEKLLGMLEVVALDAKAQVEFDPATVENFRQIGYENRRLAHADFRNDKVDAGEIGPGHRVTALYEVRLKPGAKGRVVSVRLRYKEPGTNEVPEEPPVSLGAAQVRASLKQASASYRLAAAVAQFAEVLRGSPRGKTPLGTVLKEAEAACAELDRPADAVELLELIKIAEALKR